MNFSIFKNELLKAFRNNKVIVVKTPDITARQYWHKDYSTVNAADKTIELGAVMTSDDDDDMYLDTPSKILDWARENGVDSSFDVKFISTNDEEFDYCEFKPNIGKNLALVSNGIVQNESSHRLSTSKKTYTKKQITEAIAYWQKQLKMMNEDANGYHYAYTVDPYLYVTTLNSCFATPVRKIGASHGSPVEKENPETLNKKLKRYNTCVTEDWKPAYQIILDDADGSKVFTCEKELFELLASSRQGNKELFTADDSAINDAISEFKTRHPTAEIVKYID